MLTSTALVLLMIPGLAMFYGGLVRSKNVLGTMMHSYVSMAIIGVLWVVCGYSLTFGQGIMGGFVGWNSDYFLLQGIDDVVKDGVPEYVLAMFQGKFAIITPALISGALAERVFFKGYCLFIVLWFLAVYCPLCHWVWDGGILAFVSSADLAAGKGGGLAGGGTRGRRAYVRRRTGRSGSSRRSSRSVRKNHCGLEQQIRPRLAHCQKSYRGLDWLG